jgi:hypothetical protein
MSSALRGQWSSTTGADGFNPWARSLHHIKRSVQATASRPILSREKSMRKLVAGLLLVAVSACNSDSTTSPKQNGPLTGVYVLRSVNARPLPTVAYPDPTTPLSVVYGRVELKADGSFVDSTVFSYPDGGVQRTESDVYKGTYEQDGDHITFNIAGNVGQYSMAWTVGDALTYITSDLTFLYRK